MQRRDLWLRLRTPGKGFGYGPVIDMKFHVWTGRSLDKYRATLSRTLGDLDKPTFVIDAPEINDVRINAGDFCISLGHELRALVLWEG